MKQYTITIILLLLSTISFASNSTDETSFCEWLGNSATSIAQSRNRGIAEYDLIGDYLAQDKSYGEQSVLIPLIDRAYGIARNVNPQDLAIIERTQCEIALTNNISIISGNFSNNVN